MGKKLFDQQDSDLTSEQKEANKRIVEGLSENPEFAAALTLVTHHAPFGFRFNAPQNSFGDGWRRTVISGLEANKIYLIEEAINEAIDNEKKNH